MIKRKAGFEDKMSSEMHEIPHRAWQCRHASLTSGTSSKVVFFIYRPHHTKQFKQSTMTVRGYN